MHKKTILFCIAAATIVSLQTAAGQETDGKDGKAKKEKTAREQPYVDDKYVENDVVSLDDKKGFTFSTRAGDFLLKPYVLMQASGKFNYYDAEGIDLADQDRVHNSGFEIGNAIIGFSGKAFDIVTFNVAMNASKSGGRLLQQAWFDINVKEQLRIRVGKFKTPFSQAYLVTLGETLFPMLPTSLNTAVNINESINSVNPVFGTGFDLGVQLHGLLGGKWDYRVGIFNGTGDDVNIANKTMSDDLHIPSLLYAARVAFMPNGVMPTHQGDPQDLRSNKLLFALSGSYNVEANWESSNDFRAGFEFAWLKNRFYLGAEAYLLNMNFTERQRVDRDYLFWGAYVQAGYFVSRKLQPVVRFDVMDRNSTSEKGMLNMPSAGLNWYAFRSNLKLQAMYQYMGRTGHANQDSRDRDDLGMAMHSAVVMLQFTF